MNVNPILILAIYLENSFAMLKAYMVPITSVRERYDQKLLFE